MAKGSSRGEYGKGGRTVQEVYLRKNGAVVKGPNGEKVVVGHRLKGYEYVYVADVRHVVRASVPLNSLTPTAIANADRQLTKKLNEAKGEFARLQREEDQAWSAKKQAEMEAERAAFTAEYEESKAEGEAEIAEVHRWLARNRTLTMACYMYLLDHSNVRAGLDTRRIYDSYWRNHIGVPTEVGRKALGDLQLHQLGPKVLREWEATLYGAREGYRVKEPIWDLISSQDYQQHDVIEFCETHHQKPLSPASVGKVLQFVSAVVEWAIDTDAEGWGVRHNEAARYRPSKAATKRRKTFAPRTELFHELVAAAERLDLTYMVPFMALVRNSFRPAEARAIRWCDIEQKQVGKDEMFAVKLAGTIKSRTGGERFVAEAKTDAALDEPVVLPHTTMELLRKHRKKGCDYVCFPVAGARHPFLSRDAYLEGWKKLCDAVQMPPETDVYTLKHGLIAELLLAGHSVDAITLMTRHTTREMVMRIYATIQSSDLALSIDAMTRGKPGPQS